MKIHQMKSLIVFLSAVDIDSFVTLFLDTPDQIRPQYMQLLLIVHAG